MDLSRQRQLLEGAYDWPAFYTFKFIVPAARAADVEALLPPGTTVHRRKSKRGRFVSVTGSATMESADAVLAVYEAAGRIDGIIGL
jgi:putative lipoic acid-binding regulatory protein